MDKFFPRIEGIIESISKSNALYPLLVGLVISCAEILLVFLYTEDRLLRLVSLAPSLILAWQTTRSFEYFSRNNPEMLRSETHIRQMRAIEILGDEGHRLNVDADDLVALANPNNPISSSDTLPLPAGARTQDGADNDGSKKLG